MGSGARAQNLRQAVSRDQGKFDKQRLASCLRFGGKRIDLLQAVGVSYRPSAGDRERQLYGRPFDWTSNR